MERRGGLTCVDDLPFGALVQARDRGYVDGPGRVPEPLQGGLGPGVVWLAAGRLSLPLPGSLLLLRRAADQILPLLPPEAVDRVPAAM